MDIRGVTRSVENIKDLSVQEMADDIVDNYFDTDIGEYILSGLIGQELYAEHYDSGSALIEDIMGLKPSTIRRAYKTLILQMKTAIVINSR